MFIDLYDERSWYSCSIPYGMDATNLGNRLNIPRLKSPYLFSADARNLPIHSH